MRKPQVINSNLFLFPPRRWPKTHIWVTEHRKMMGNFLSHINTSSHQLYLDYTTLNQMKVCFWLVFL